MPGVQPAAPAAPERSRERPGAEKRAPAFAQARVERSFSPVSAPSEKTGRADLAVFKIFRRFSRQTCLIPVTSHPRPGPARTNRTPPDAPPCAEAFGRNTTQEDTEQLSPRRSRRALKQKGVHHGDTESTESAQKKSRSHRRMKAAFTAEIVEGAEEKCTHHPGAEARRGAEERLEWRGSGMIGPCRHAANGPETS